MLLAVLAEPFTQLRLWLENQVLAFYDNLGWIDVVVLVAVFFTRIFLLIDLTREPRELRVLVGPVFCLVL